MKSMRIGASATHMAVAAIWPGSGPRTGSRPSRVSSGPEPPGPRPPGPRGGRPSGPRSPGLRPLPGGSAVPGWPGRTPTSKVEDAVIASSLVHGSRPMAAGSGGGGIVLHDVVPRRAGHAVFVGPMMHDRILVEVLERWRRTGGPLERGRMPRIGRGLGTAGPAPDQIQDEQELRRDGD